MTRKNQQKLISMPALCLGLLLLTMTFANSQLALAQRIPLDKIVALVDEDVVLQSELNARLKEIRDLAVRTDQPIPNSAEFEAGVLEALIIENLQMQFAARISIRFDDDTINRVLASMGENNNMGFEEYVDVLKDAGVYLQTREQVRSQMTMQELQRGMVNRRITITDQEIENFLNSEMGREIMSADYQLEHMMVPTSDSDSAAVTAAKLIYTTNLVLRIEEGESLPNVRAAAMQGGDYPVTTSRLGIRKAKEFPTIFSEIVANMDVQDVEGPIEAGNGFHIIQLIQKRGGTDQMVSQTNLRHIMLIPNEIRNNDQTREAIAVLRERILAGEDFNTIARQNSDDASSVVGGGELDWVNEGGMPIEMETTIATMEFDEISEPFRTDTGWHIAQVLDRRITDLSGEYSRQQAENALRSRKFDLELENWLIEIREEAFVELID